MTLSKSSTGLSPPTKVLYRRVLVAGAPGSGKNAYVEAHRTPGDLVVDVDAIWMAITAGTDDRECRTEALLPTMLAVRQILIDRIGRGDVPANSWILTSQPSGENRGKLAMATNSAMLLMDTPEATCHARILEEKGAGVQRRLGLMSGWFVEFTGNSAERLIKPDWSK